YSGDGDDLSGYLMFENADGTAAPVSAERLGQAFRRTVRLAVINACEGAAGDMRAPSTGVATSLLQQGIPAVVAMQFSISDAIAIP
ncbi:MAG: CHAT domain-containing protein, partial [Caldilineaceae bacterium]|nr:CHAT domain-containing protein [Caldilineaceae bacterium]